MSQESSTISQQAAPSGSSHDEHGGSRLGPFLCWAVVFADIGTSVYYTPGILYGQVSLAAGLFVTMTLIVFLLLTLKYAEVSVRFPQGGGVVTVAARGLHPWAGAVGGMFILVDYFLTSAISSDSGLTYLSAVFRSIAPLVLPLTLLVVALLGVLNWWGIKESATVSLAFAVGAFVIDIVILLAVAIHVPFHAISQAFGEMFSGSLTPVTVLTGFAGSFLAFSGLESISQLSPVMRVPRHKTVTVALALVIVTVGVTSPLLTIFSTTLLTTCTPHFTVCSPHVLQASLAARHAQPDPNQFISELAALAGGTTFGRLLEILTAVTASTLLIFASNTAIIGAYHVFLALSRMRFLPRIVERRNHWRETPHISIILATGIPMLVLLAVAGNINILGDMYAFGLLGAFSLTCIALDAIRWRERRRDHENLTLIELDERAEQEMSHDGFAPHGAVAARTTAPPLAGAGASQSGPMSIGGLGMSGRRWAALARGATLRLWPDVKYYLGFLTTFLVCVAWLTNLKSKPLATEFGGGLTVLGVAISVVNYRRQQSRGETPIFPMLTLRRMPDSALVVLPATSEHNRQVIQAAFDLADSRTLVFLYLGEPVVRDLRVMQFNDPYFYDLEAQATFSAAARLAVERHVTSFRFVYRIGGPGAIASAWRQMRPEQIIAEASVAKKFTKQVSPKFVRFKKVDDVRVASYMLPTAGGAAPEATVEKVAPGGPAPSESVHNGHAAPGAPDSSVPQYRWTGTQLVREDELPPPEREPDGEQ
ncbi:MAG TPA: APC family permease [Ktedonobacterales bacterium]|nr:APC family permease [Ktedonobacterales bacterium]